MKVKDSYKLSESESVLYLELNWFDLTSDTQNKIMDAVSKADGPPDCSFIFPTINVRLLLDGTKMQKGDKT